MSGGRGSCFLLAQQSFLREKMQTWPLVTFLVKVTLRLWPSRSVDVRATCTSGSICTRITQGLRRLSLCSRSYFSYFAWAPVTERTQGNVWFDLAIFPSRDDCLGLFESCCHLQLTRNTRYHGVVPFKSLTHS